MKGITITLLIGFIGFVSCKWNNSSKEQFSPVTTEYIEIVTDDYELYKPNTAAKAVLILFGGFPENASIIRREFKILELARENDIAVILSNYNKKLWLNKNEKHELASNLQSIIEDNQLPVDNIIIGGFSSGGVVSLLLSDFIIGMKQFYIDPQGVFIVDSPVDLSGVYNYCEKSINRNFSEPSVRESTYLLELLENNLGNPNDNIEVYEDKSVFTLRTNNTASLSKLKNTKIRFYAEPDTVWWKDNRMVEYEELNAFYINKLYSSLTKQGFEKVEYISTKDKGYRSNGARHPHSWSIVDKRNLVNWILRK